MLNPRGMRWAEGGLELRPPCSRGAGGRTPCPEGAVVPQCHGVGLASLQSSWPPPPGGKVTAMVPDVTASHRESQPLSPSRSPVVLPFPQEPPVPLLSPTRNGSRLPRPRHPRPRWAERRSCHLVAWGLEINTGHSRIKIKDAEC